MTDTKDALLLAVSAILAENVMYILKEGIGLGLVQDLINSHFLLSCKSRSLKLKKKKKSVAINHPLSVFFLTHLTEWIRNYISKPIHKSRILLN